MDRVVLEEENQFTTIAPATTTKNGLTDILIRTGLAKDDKSAQYVLIVIVLVIICTAIAVLAFSHTQDASSLPDNAVIITPPGQGPRLLTPLTSQP